jgi:hypothetical protein
MDERLLEDPKNFVAESSRDYHTKTIEKLKRAKSGAQTS